MRVVVVVAELLVVVAADGMEAAEVVVGQNRLLPIDWAHQWEQKQIRRRRRRSGIVFSATDGTTESLAISSFFTGKLSPARPTQHTGTKTSRTTCSLANKRACTLSSRRTDNPLRSRLSRRLRVKHKTCFLALLAKVAAAEVVVAVAVVVSSRHPPPQVVAQLLRKVGDAVAVVVVDAATALEAVVPGAAVAVVLGAESAAMRLSKRENRHNTRTCSTSMLLSQEPGPSLQRLQVAVTQETQRPQLVLRALERYQR